MDQAGSSNPTRGLKKEVYQVLLHNLWIETVKMQRELIRSDTALLVLVEGRDAAGKDGAIKRLTRHLSPRETRIFAPRKPTELDQKSWYFQRFVPQLPGGGELVVFNRSWYNRAGVERVMGFCRPSQTESFLREAPIFEGMLVRDDVMLRKYYFDISRETQVERLEARRTDPLKAWKISSVDQRAVELWDAYTEARNAMLERTHSTDAPWWIIPADDKRSARISFLSHLLRSLDYRGKDETMLDQIPCAAHGFTESSVLSD